MSINVDSVNCTVASSASADSVQARVIKYPFVEINNTILNLNAVQTAYPYNEETVIVVGGDETYYKISYDTFKKLIKKSLM